ncbi:MAG TPA: N-6 DNA methylase [Allosphingosinicella sp.]
MDRGKAWRPDWLWSVFEELDRVLNGSIFPLSLETRDAVKAEHIEFVRGVIGFSDSTSPAGTQLGLFKADLSVIRTETLSAIYEQFLSRDGDQKGTDAAFYTPPFLVDFVIDEVETKTPLTRESTILDGSAGSGVFLVSAYRRLIEKELPPGKRHLDHSKLAEILRGSIFAIERHPDACHVAAFSLYLTMLDYIDPAELRLITNSRSVTRLFPSLVWPSGSNILTRDIFEMKARPKGFPQRFDLILGNPPWGSVSKMRSPELAKSFLHRIARTHHVGDEQIADLFFWRLTRWFLKRGGTAALVMPLKSFINKRSKLFVKTIGKKMAFLEFANLSHMRRRLFRSAIHPAVIVFVQRTKRTRTTIYSPTLAEQPIGRDKSLWTLVKDRSRTESIPDTSAEMPERFLHDALVRRPVDRQIADYLHDQVRLRKAIDIRTLATRGLLWKSGDEARRTGLPSEYHLTTDIRSDRHICRHLKVGPDGWWVPYQSSGSISPLPLDILQSARGKFRHFFAGNILAVPRSLECVFRVRSPAAFNSSFNLFSVAEEAPDRPTLLAALAAYLESSTFRYLAALHSRQMMVDRWVIELDSILDVPFPLRSADSLHRLAAAPPGHLREMVILEEFGLPGSYFPVIEEFLDHRIFFANGNIPFASMEPVEDRTLSEYAALLSARLKGMLGTDSITTDFMELGDRKLRVLSISTEWSRAPKATTDDVMHAYDAAGADIFSVSTFVHHDKTSDVLYLVKPEQSFRWTLDNAYSDADVVDKKLMVDVH